MFSPLDITNHPPKLTSPLNVWEGALATCRAMTRHAQDPVIQERGCDVFQGLAQGSRKGWQAVVSCGGLKRVSYAMQHFLSLRELQKAAFEALMAMPREASREMEAAGCHQALVASMSAYPSDLKLLVTGCHVIKQMAAGKIDMQAARPLLMSYIKDFPDEVSLLVASTDALAEISIQGGSHGSDRHLVQSISNFLVAHKKDPKVQAAGLNGFRAMAIAGSQSVEAAQEARCIERARMALLDHKDDEMVQSRGIELLRRVAAYSSNLRDTIVEEGLYPLIIAAQDSCKKSPEVCRQSIHAAGTLLGFVTSSTAQSRQEERMRMMIQSAAKAKAAAQGTQQRGASLAYGKLVKETDLCKFAMCVDELMIHHKHSSLFLQDACHVLRCLAEASDDGLKAVHGSGVLPTLMAALQKHRRLQAVNFHGFRVLWGLLKTAASIREALEAGIVEWSAAALSRFSECVAAQTAVLLVVNRLCLGAPEVKVQCLKAKIIPTTLHIFQQNESNILLRSRCLATLANIGSNYPEAVKEMSELDILELSVEMFHRHSDNAQLQSRCLQLLWAFIKEGDQKVADEICTQEMMEAVLQAVQRHSASEPLLAEAFGFLWNFTKEHEKKDWFFSKDGLQKLFTALEAFPRSSLIQKQGFELLRSLSMSLKPERVEELATEKTMDLAKVAMKVLRHDPRVASAALGVLGNLACSNTKFKKDVFLQDCPQEVLLVMEEHARDVGVQALGTWALSNFVGVSRKRARELYELGGKDRIFVAMSEHALNDTIKVFGPSLIRRLELVQELTVNAVNMEEDEEELFEGKGFAVLDAGSDTSKVSGDEESSEDSDIKAKIQALAQQTQGTESEEVHRSRGGVKIRDD